MLTLEQQATNAETLTHIQKVRNFLSIIILELIKRGGDHDLSKLESPEVEIFSLVTSRLAGLTYGSKEYNDQLTSIGPALEHHYAKNRHHPQHFANGVNDMNLIDVIEMFCDWKASTLRHSDGNIRKSIEHNAKRFEISRQLEKIFENSVELFE